MLRLKALGRQVQAALERPTWVQDVLALASVAAVIYLGVRGLPIPDVLSGIAWCIIGYFFGSHKADAVAADRAASTGTADGPEKKEQVPQRTQHGRGRTRLIHFRCVEPDREASPE